jgi:cytosine permease
MQVLQCGGWIYFFRRDLIYYGPSPTGTRNGPCRITEFVVWRNPMSELPNYVTAAQPVPAANRVAWYKTTAQTYAGIMLWFVFWQTVPSSGAPGPAGILAHGLGTAVLGVVVAALICHFASYLAPGLMGMKTGLPLAVVGTSTYGVTGGFLMPGFFMGVLQFGWLAVNAWFSAELLAGLAGFPPKSPMHLAIGCIWAAVAAFVGLKGIHYVAKVATYLPLIPLVILLVLMVKTASGIGNFKPELLTAAAKTPSPGSLELLLFAVANIVGFFATAGAAGVDIASSNRDSKDVQLGGLVGVAGVTIFTGCLALVIVAGAYGAGLVPADKGVVLKPTELMGAIMGEGVAKVFWLLLALAAFPPACFSSLIAAASFKNTLPKVNPFISCGLGTAASIALVLSGKAGDAEAVFGIIGASFGPICGAMTADYLLAGCKWPGPRAGFNPAGWISWAVGFVVGAWNSLFAATVGFQMPCPPVAAIIVGFVLYLILAKVGLESRTLAMPQRQG